MASNTIEHVVKIDTAQARADVDSFAAHVASRLKALESPVKIGVGLPSTAVTPSAPSGGSGISVNPMQGALSTNIALKTMTNGIMAATQAIQAFTAQLTGFRIPAMPQPSPTAAIPTIPPRITPRPPTAPPRQSEPSGGGISPWWGRISGIGDSFNSAIGGLMPGQGGGMASMLTGFGGGLVKAGATLASGIAMAFGPMGAVAGSVIGILGTVTAGLFNAFGQLGDFLLSIPGMIFNAAKQILIAGGALAAAFAGSVYAAHKALGPAAEMEGYKNQLAFMKKPELLPFYEKVDQQSSFNLKEIMGAGIMTENYGLNSKQYLPLFTDMATALHKPIEEFARTFGWAKGGNTGFAFENARQWGINQQMMEAKGIRFDANGGVKDEDKTKFLDALTEIAQKKFGGYSEKQAGGYNQLISNLESAIFKMFAKGGEGQGGASSALTWGKEIVKSITDTITFFGDKLSAIDWAGIGASFSVVTDKIGEAFKASNWQSWTDSFSRTADAFGNAVESFTTWAGLTKFVTLLESTGINLIILLGSVLSKVPGLMLDGFKQGYDWIVSNISNVSLPSVSDAAGYGGLAVAPVMDVFSNIGNTFDSLMKGKLPSSYITPYGDYMNEQVAQSLAKGKGGAPKTPAQSLLGDLDTFIQKQKVAMATYTSSLVPSSDKIDKIAYQRTKGIGEKVARGEYEPEAKSIFPYSENIRKNLEASLKTPEQRQQESQQKMIDAVTGNFDILKTALNAVKEVQQTQDAIATMTSQMLEELRQQSQISQSAFAESFQV